jgi:hypothetical protein
MELALKTNWKRGKMKRCVLVRQSKQASAIAILEHYGIDPQEQL